MLMLPSSAVHKRWPALLLAVLWIASTACAVQASGALRLQLEVSINGLPTGLIAQFWLDPVKRLSTTPAELQDLRITTPPSVNQGATVPLDSLPGLSYRYDEGAQKVDISVPDRIRIPLQLKAIDPAAVLQTNPPLAGALVNYSLLGTLYDDSLSPSAGYVGGLRRAPQTLSLDTRLFGPAGTLTNSGFIGNGINRVDTAVRLDSTWSWSDPETNQTVRAGDFITGGLAWNRPVRLGGLEMRRDFGLRPDLITAPLPALSGSAAVPSTVDVFINNVKTFSKDIEAGPFTVADLPATTGAGMARVVVRDSEGHESIQQAAFFQAATLLKPGLFDYSVEAGFARGQYGSRSFVYDDRLVGSGSLRYGLSELLTLEGHAEGGAGVLNGGGGVTFNAFNRGAVSVAASASADDGDLGGQIYIGIQSQAMGININLSSQRTIGPYQDLAGMLGQRLANIGYPVAVFDKSSFLPPRTLDTASFGFALPDTAGTIGIGVVHRESATDKSNIISGSYTRPLIENASLFISGFDDVRSNNLGFFAGISLPLGDNGNAQTGASKSGNQGGVFASYSKAASLEPGSWGWTISTNEGSVENRSADVTYQGDVARIKVGWNEVARSNRVSGTIDGALVATPDGVFLSNTIYDGFAVVNVGAPGVDVLLENRRVASTNDDGRALVPGLKPYQSNKIDIDTTSLPAEFRAPETSATAIPGGMTGVSVDLRVEDTSDSGLIVFRDAKANYIQAGSHGSNIETGELFIVGYDGRAYLQHLHTVNRVKLETTNGSCWIAFDFAPQRGRQTVIEAPPCQ